MPPQQPSGPDRGFFFPRAPSTAPTLQQEEAERRRREQQPPTATTSTRRGFFFPTPDNQLRDALTSPTTTETAKRVLDLQQQTGLPPPVIERNLEQVQQEADKRRVDQSNLRLAAPQLAYWLSGNPTAAAAVRGDLPQLTKLEHAISFGGSILRAWDDTRSLLGRTVQTIGQILPREITTPEGVTIEMGPRIAREARAYAERYERSSAALGPRTTADQVFAESGEVNPAILGQYLKEQAGAGIVMMGPAIVTGYLGGLVAGAAGVPITVGSAIGAAVPLLPVSVGETQAEIAAIDPEGVHPGMAWVGGTAITAFDVAVPGARIGSRLARYFGAETAERIFTRLALRPLKSSWLAKTARGLFTNMTIEGFTEALQEAIGMEAAAYATGTSTPEDYWARLREAGIAGLVQSAMFDVATTAVVGRREMAAHNRALAAARQQEQAFTDIGEGAANSDTVKTAPAVAREFLQQVGPIKTVYADLAQWNAYWTEQGLNPAVVAAEVTGNATAYDDAQVGGLLEIPTAQYTVNLAGTEHNGFWAKELKIDARIANRREVDERAQALEAQLAAEPTEEQAGYQALYDRVLAQLEEAGQRPDVAAAQAELRTAALMNQAAIRGIDPTTIELPAVTNEALAAQAGELAQGAPVLPHQAVVSSNEENGEHQVRLPGGAGAITLMDIDLAKSKAAELGLSPEVLAQFPPGYLLVAQANTATPGQGDGRKLYEAAQAFARSRGFKGLMSNPAARSAAAEGLWRALERDGIVRRKAEGTTIDVVDDTGGELVQPVTGKAIPPAAEAATNIQRFMPQVTGPPRVQRIPLKTLVQSQVRASLKELGVSRTGTLDISRPEVRAYLTRMAITEAEQALVNNPAAVGWYDSTVRQALAILAILHPEILTDPKSEFAFKAALAITSQRVEVPQNLSMAMQAYRQWQATGTMPTTIGTGPAAPSINRNLEMFNQLYAEQGWEALRDFMAQQFTVKQLEALGFSVSGEKKTRVVRGAAIFGAKIGNGFYSNLYGLFDELTMDTWFVRTFQRWTGRLLERRPALVDESRRRMADTIARMSDQTRKAFANIIEVDVPAKPTTDELNVIGEAVFTASQVPANRVRMDRTRAGAELRMAGNRYGSNVRGEREAPRNASEREWMREVIQGALTELNRRKYDLTTADVQALLWFAEKRLYAVAAASKPLEGGYISADAPDYANAAAEFVEAQGIDTDRIAAARGSIAPRPPGARPGTLEPGAGPGAAGGPGYPGGARLGAVGARAEARAGAPAEVTKKGELFQRVEPPDLTSRLILTARESTLAKASGQQWKATLRNAKRGVNADEWMIADLDALEDGTTYTKQEILDYLAANVPRVEVVDLTEGGGQIDPSDLERRTERIYDGMIESEEESIRENSEGPDWISEDDIQVEEELDDDGDLVGYNAYVKIGRERIELASDPDEDVAKREAINELEARNDRIRDSWDEEIRDAARENVSWSEAEEQAEQELRDEGEAEGGTKFTEYVEPGADEGSNREVFLTLPNTSRIAGGRGFRDATGAVILTREMDDALLASATGEYEDMVRAVGRGNQRQFDEAVATALAQLRAFERPSTRTLFAVSALERLAGRRVHDITHLSATEWKDGHSDYDEIENPFVRLRLNLRTADNGRVTLFLEEVQPPQDEEFAKMPPLLQKNWRELAFRWAVREAVTLGADELAWTTGKQQTRRYDLRKVAHRIEYYPATKQLAAYDKPRTFSVQQRDDGRWIVRNEQGEVIPGAGSHPDQENAERAMRLMGGGSARELLRRYDVKPEDIPRYLGKELAERLLAGPTAEKPSTTYGAPTKVGNHWYVTDADGDIYTPGGAHPTRGAAELAREKLIAALPKAGTYSLEGEGLEVGGAGLTRLYDKDFPNIVNRIVKPAGVSVGEGSIGVGTEMVHDVDAEGRTLPTWRAEPKREPVHAIPITESVKALVHKGLPLFQEGGDGIRGAYNPVTDGIRLTAKANLSSFLHESGHQYLEQLMANAVFAGGIAPDVQTSRQRQVQVDAGTVLRWFNFTGTVEEWLALPLDARRDHHERFADAFLTYLSTGKAPSARLRPAFARFRAWLGYLFRTMQLQRVEVSEEVRGVMDRMLASDEAIAEVQASTDTAPALFTDPATAGVDQATFDAYREQMEAANLQMREQVDRPLFAEWRRERMTWWETEREQMRKQVASEANQNPALVAQSLMRTGKLPDGTIPPNGDGLPLKLDKADVVARFGIEILPKLRIGFDYLYTVSGGLPVDVLAQTLGYPTPQALIDAVTGPRVERVIADTTQARMEEAHGSLTDDVQAMRDLADDALQDQRAAVVSRELEILTAGMARAALPERGQLKAAAEARMARTKVRDLKPHLYVAAAQKAGREAFTAFGKNDRQGAIDAKVRELTALAFHRAARDAKARSEVVRTYAAKWDRPSMRKRIGKAGQDYLDQADYLRARFEFARISQVAIARRQSLRDFIEKVEKRDLLPTAIPQDVIDDARQVNWQELTVDELEGVHTGLKQIEHLATLKTRLIQGQRKRELNEVAAEINSSIRANLREAPKTHEPPSRGDLEDKQRDFFDGFHAAHRKIAFIIHELDGHRYGPMFDAVMRRLNEAASAKQTMSADALAKLTTIFRAYNYRELIAMSEKVHIPALGAATNPLASLSKWARILVALNVGNETNRKRLMDGKGWTSAQVDAILDGLDQRDWDTVQAIWDFVNTYWEPIVAKQQRVVGVAPKKEEASPVTTKYRVYRGGYFPVIFDKDLEPQQAVLEEASAAEFQKMAAYLHLVPPAGHLTERVEGDVKKQMRLDPGVIWEHVDRVIHDLTHHEMLIDVGRILAHDDVRTAIIDTLGMHEYQQFLKNLREVAVGDSAARHEGEQVLGHMRAGSTIFGLAWNTVSASLQWVGITNTLVHIGKAPTGRAIGMLFRGAVHSDHLVRAIKNESTFMRYRKDSALVEVAQARAKFGLDGGSLAQLIDYALTKAGRAARLVGPTGKVRGTRKVEAAAKDWLNSLVRAAGYDGLASRAIAESFFTMLTTVQFGVDVITYLAAKDKAASDPGNWLPNGKLDEARVIAIAEQEVANAQSSSLTKDIAAVQTGSPAWKLWINFYSAFNNTYNITLNRKRQVFPKQSDSGLFKTIGRNPAKVALLAVDYMILYVLSTAAMHAWRGMIAGTLDDEDLEAFLWAVGRESFAMGFGTMVILRELGGAIQGFTQYAGPAGMRAIPTMGRLITQVAQGEWDEGLWKAMLETTEGILHWPGAQINKTLSGIIALADGEADEPWDYVTYPLFGPEQETRR